MRELIFLGIIQLLITIKCYKNKIKLYKVKCNRKTNCTNIPKAFTYLRIALQSFDYPTYIIKCSKRIFRHCQLSKVNVVHAFYDRPHPQGICCVCVTFEYRRPHKSTCKWHELIRPGLSCSGPLFFLSCVFWEVAENAFCVQRSTINI